MTDKPSPVSPISLDYSLKRPGSSIAVEETATGLTIEVPPASVLKELRGWFAFAGLCWLVATGTFLWMWWQIRSTAASFGAPPASLPLTRYQIALVVLELVASFAFPILFVWIFRLRLVLRIDAHEVSISRFFTIRWFDFQRSWPLSEVKDARVQLMGVRFRSTTGRTLTWMPLPDRRDRAWVCQQINSILARR